MLVVMVLVKPAAHRKIIAPRPAKIWSSHQSGMPRFSIEKHHDDRRHCAPAHPRYSFNLTATAFIMSGRGGGGGRKVLLPPM